MNVRRLYIIVALSFLAMAVSNCGRDTVAPSDPASAADIPPVVFFNSSPGAEIALRGTASDSTKVAEVSVAINGTDFTTATIEPPGGAQTVKWIYMATAAELPAGANTILVKAVDSSDNETISSPIVVESTSGSTTGELLAVLANPALADTIGLSTGEGFAYGDSAATWTIPIDTGKAILGAGTATVLEADPLHPWLFSVGADLHLQNLLVKGAELGVAVMGSPGADPFVTVEECSFEGQSDWAIYALDDDDGTAFQFLSSSVDASAADSSSRGGLYLEGVTYFVSGSEFYNQTDPGGPGDSAETGAAVQIIGGSGQITESLFDDNALAIWASGGSPVIDSCNIYGAAFTTYGINLTGGPGTPLIQQNYITGNSGYGIRIGGSMMAKVRETVITSNDWAGIYIDFSGTASQVNKIDLGKGLAEYGVNDPGNNDLIGNGNSNPDPEGTNEVQVYVSSNTAIQKIPAELNYWGVDNALDVNKVIRDGSDFTLDRGYLDPSPFFVDPQN